MTNGIKGFLSNPIASYTAARQPGGFLAPTENFQDFLSDPRTSIGIQIAQGVPIGQALLGGALQAKQIEDVKNDIVTLQKRNKPGDDQLIIQLQNTVKRLQSKLNKNK